MIVPLLYLQKGAKTYIPLIIKLATKIIKVLDGHITNSIYRLDLAVQSIRLELVNKRN